MSSLKDDRVDQEQKVDHELPADIAGLSFEQALEELEAIVRQLETGRAKLDDAIGSYERGAALKRHCEMKLNDAKVRVERIAFAGDGTVKAEAFSTE